MSDIVKRARKHAKDVLDPGYPYYGTPELVREMADEIARLRRTDEEREAIERLCEATNDMIDNDKRAGGCFWQDDAAAVAAARGLLERTGGGG